MTPVFSVEPEEVELKPGTACYFSIYGKSADVDRFSETLVCETKLAKEKNFKKSGGLVCDSQGSFIAPKLELSCENMDFVYTWEDGVPTAQSVKSFVAAGAFDGARRGQVFKKDARGLGYYRDA